MIVHFYPSMFLLFVFRGARSEIFRGVVSTLVRDGGSREKALGLHTRPMQSNRVERVSDSHHVDAPQDAGASRLTNFFLHFTLLHTRLNPIVSFPCACV